MFHLVAIDPIAIEIDGVRSPFFGRLARMKDVYIYIDILYIDNVKIVVVPFEKKHFT